MIVKIRIECDDTQQLKGHLINMFEKVIILEQEYEEDIELTSSEESQLEDNNCYGVRTVKILSTENEDNNE